MNRAYRVSDVRGAEQPLLDAGEPLMERASYALAQAVIRNLKDNGHRVPGSTVLALVGEGNNGGDALFASAELARRGLKVTVVTGSGAHLGGLAAVRALRVPVIHNPEINELCEIARSCGTWIDGLLGIGARGPMRDPFASWVQALRRERAASPAEPYVVAVDTPSGIGIDDGTVPGEVLPADVTVTMGCAKPGLYLPPARFLCGRIVEVPLEFEPYLPAEPALVQLTDADVRDLVKIPGVTDHKYTRGVLGMFTGSVQYPGAGVLSAAGARACGVGMIRHLSHVSQVVQAYPDIVAVPGQVQAWLIGSGLPPLTHESDPAYDDALARDVVEIFDSALDDHLPMVLDAGAIGLVYERDVSANVVITPHAGELTALLQARGEALTRSQVEAAPARAARLAATLTGATVVAKGSCTVIADAQSPLYAQAGGPAWLATAGAGDILAGIIAALIASHADNFGRGGDPSIAATLAACACHIHARAGALAAGVPWIQTDLVDYSAGCMRVGHPITATDIVKELPTIFDDILNV